MLSEHEQQEDSIMDSDEYVEPTLAEKFELQRLGLSSGETVDFLTDTIEALEVDGVKVISIVGGAASGKSTLAESIIVKLAAAGVNADVLRTDDYTKGDRTWRWEHFEGKDVDPTGKYDFELMNKKVQDIKQIADADETVAVPSYNQGTGLAVDEGEANYTHRVGKVSVLIIEGDFHPVDEPNLVVYLHVPDKQRLQNRVNRDVVERGGDPVKTTNSFNFRHTNQHLPHTLPTLVQADYAIVADTRDDQWLFGVYAARPKLVIS
jgi:uridine kinase